MPSDKAAPSAYSSGMRGNSKSKMVLDEVSIKKMDTHDRLVDALFCSVGCREAYAKDGETIVDQPRAGGFTQYANAPNAYIKDGMLVTIREIRHHGPEATLQAHQIIAGDRAASERV